MLRWKCVRGIDSSDPLRQIENPWGAIGEDDEGFRTPRRKSDFAHCTAIRWGDGNFAESPHQLFRWHRRRCQQDFAGRPAHCNDIVYRLINGSAIGAAPQGRRREYESKHHRES